MLLARMKKEYKKLLEDDNLEMFIEPDITTEIKFDSRDNLEDDEWFYIEIDEKHEEMIADYSSHFSSSASLNDVSDDDFSKIDIIFKQLEKEKLIFQKITPSKRLVHRKYLKKPLNKKVEINTIEHGIEISEKIDAYFDGCDRLYFKKFATIKSMFKCIECYYREANDKEIREFKNYSIIDIKDDLVDIGTRNMKMIAVIADDDKIDLESKDFNDKLLKNHEKYPEKNFQIERGRFIINTKKQLTDFLKLAIGELYENPMTNEKMEASSAKKLSS